jgi:hypothetical protein
VQGIALSAAYHEDDFGQGHDLGRALDCTVVAEPLPGHDVPGSYPGDDAKIAQCAAAQGGVAKIGAPVFRGSTPLYYPVAKEPSVDWGRRAEDFVDPIAGTSTCYEDVFMSPKMAAALIHQGGADAWGFPQSLEKPFLVGTIQKLRYGWLLVDSAEHHLPDATWQWPVEITHGVDLAVGPDGMAFADCVARNGGIAALAPSDQGNGTGKRQLYGGNGMDGWAQDFSGTRGTGSCVMQWTGTTGYFVGARVRQAWLGVSGRPYIWPLEDEHPTATGTLQQFDAGWVIWDRATDTVTLSKTKP